jgi:D-ribulokinase
MIVSVGHAAGLDVGSGGVRAVALDSRLRVAARAERPLPRGRRTAHGGHRLDEGAILDAARAVLDEVSRRAGPLAAIAVSGTAGTLCLRDAAGRRAAEAVAYDDTRHGSGLERVAAWRRRVPRARRVVPVADAVLEALGAEPGATDWTNALKLGWDPVAGRWPPAARSLRGAGFLPEAVPPGSPAGRGTPGSPAAGALLVRGTTDGCALELAAGDLQPGRWTVSLGTTVTWRAVVTKDAAWLRPPTGAYLHRLRHDLWLLSAAGNSGGGVLESLEPGADLAALDAGSAVPTGLAAYPLARPGERFPVRDPRFPGFGLPGADDPRRHAAILEGVALVIRLGLDRLATSGLAAPRRLRATGGGARSPLWMRLLAAATGCPVTAAPDAGPALGMALLAAATLTGAAPGAVGAGDVSPTTEHAVDPGLAAALEERYAELGARVAAWERSAAAAAARRRRRP